MIRKRIDTFDCRVITVMLFDCMFSLDKKIQTSLYKSAIVYLSNSDFELKLSELLAEKCYIVWLLV